MILCCLRQCRRWVSGLFRDVQRIRCSVQYTAHQYAAQCRRTIRLRHRRYCCKWPSFFAFMLKMQRRNVYFTLIHASFISKDAQQQYCVDVLHNKMMQVLPRMSAVRSWLRTLSSTARPAVCLVQTSPFTQQLFMRAPRSLF